MMRAFIQQAKQQLATLYTPQEINRIVRLLLEKWASVDTVSFYADKDRKIPPSVLITLQKALDRLAQHEPLEYVLGTADFTGLRLRVDSRVLIPRPETEELVEWILQDHPKKGDKIPGRMLDVCTGSGCIAIALAKEWPDSYTEGWDVSPEALELAILNATDNKTTVQFKCIDLLTYLPMQGDTGPFDLIVSNPPYVRRSESSEMTPDVLDYEPHLALFVEDKDPLVFYKAIARLGMSLLKTSGSVYVEINEQLGEQTKSVFEHEGYTLVTLKKDLFGKDRFVRAVR